MHAMTANSFGSRTTLRSGETDHVIYRLDAVDGAGSLPFSLKILLENLLRNEDGRQVAAEHITALAQWDPAAEPATEEPPSDWDYVPMSEWGDEVPETQ